MRAKAPRPGVAGFEVSIVAGFEVSTEADLHETGVYTPFLSP